MPEEVSLRTKLCFFFCKQLLSVGRPGPSPLTVLATIRGQGQAAPGTGAYLLVQPASTALSESTPHTSQGPTIGRAPSQVGPARWSGHG